MQTNLVIFIGAVASADSSFIILLKNLLILGKQQPYDGEIGIWIISYTQMA